MLNYFQKIELKLLQAQSHFELLEAHRSSTLYGPVLIEMNEIIIIVLWFYKDENGILYHYQLQIMYCEVEVV